MNFNPGLNKASLTAWQAAVEHLSGFDGEYGLIASVHRMDVRQVVLASVQPIPLLSG